MSPISATTEALTKLTVVMLAYFTANLVTMPTTTTAIGAINFAILEASGLSKHLKR